MDQPLQRQLVGFDASLFSTLVHSSTVSKLPLADHVATPKLPKIILNDENLSKNAAKDAAPIVDKDTDAELRKKFLEMRLQERPTPPIPVLHIPNKVINPQRPAQRRLARGTLRFRCPQADELSIVLVKAGVIDAPRPQITFGETVTVFGIEVTKEARTPTVNKDKETSKDIPPSEEEENESKENVKEDTSENKEGSPKHESPSESLVQPIKVETSKEAQRRLLREKRERYKPRLPPPPPPDPSEALTEGKRKAISLELPTKPDTKDEKEKRKQELKSQFKKLAILMAKDIHEKKIPKSQLKMLTRGKSPEEAAVMLKIVDKAWGIAVKLREKDHERRAKEREVVEEEKSVGNESESESDASDGDEKKIEAKRRPKGKERAPGWSIADSG